VIPVARNVWFPILVLIPAAFARHCTILSAPPLKRPVTQHLGLAVDPDRFGSYILPRLIALRQQLGMTHLNGSDFEIVGDLVKVLGRFAQRISDITLMHHGCQPPRVLSLFAVVFGRVHTPSTRVP